MLGLWNRMIFLVQVLGSFICYEAVLLLTATKTPQYFTSANYPGHYHSYSDYIWRIRAVNSSYIIRLEVLDSLMESHSSCFYDGVSVYDGNLSPDNYPYRSQKLGTFCGKKTPTYLSSGEYMVVWFYSDYSYEYKGFKIKYYSGLSADLKHEKDEEESSNLGLIIGGIVGGILVLGVIVACVGCCVSHSKKNGRSVTPSNRVNITSLSNRNNCSYNAHLFSSTFVPPPAYSRYDESQHRNITPVGTRDVRERNASENNRNTTNNSGNGRRISIGIASAPMPPERTNPPSSHVLPSTQTMNSNSPTITAENEPIHYQYEPFPLPFSPPPPYTPTPPQNFQPTEQESRM